MELRVPLTIAVTLLSGAALLSCDRSGDTAPPAARTAAAAGPPPGLVDGARVIQQRGCLRCHGWEGVRVLEEGPSLDHAGDKLRAEWIDGFLSDPSKSRMPVIAGLDDEARRKLVSFLSGLKRDLDFTAAGEGDAQRGAELYEKHACAQCHRPERPEPDLALAPAKLKRDWLVSYLEDPQAAQPRARMPSFGLSREDASDLAAFLLQGSAPSRDAKASKEGLDTFVELRCITCHPLQRYKGMDMQDLLAGQRSFDAHLRGSGGVPRIVIGQDELRAARGVLGEWTVVPPGGSEMLAETNIARHWIVPIPPQGPAPADWTGLERSLNPAACGTCHPRQYYDWSGSLHARAFSYGFEADMLFEGEGRCTNCHAPLTEQQAISPLRATGVNCTSCHVRSNARHAPPLAQFDLLEPNRDGAHGGARREAYFEDSRFCALCHQFREGESPQMQHGFVLNTVAEWESSPAAREGKTCQSCHMPDRRHLWRGIHDPRMVRENLQVSVEGRRILLTSLAGHFMPTYPKPEIIVSAWLEDAAGGELDATRRSWTIQRKMHLEFGSEYRDIADTRLAPGETRVYEYDARAEGAANLVVSVDVEPDAYYRRLYRSRLEMPEVTGQMRQLYQLAFDYPLAPPFNVTVIRTPQIDLQAGTR